MNIQELQTVFYHKLPIKLFVLNNEGYISMRQTQESFFQCRYVACDEKSGVSFPNIIKVAKAYGLSAERIPDHHSLKKRINKILSFNGPVVCEVMLSRDYKFSPKLSSEKKPDGRLVSKPLEDMYPFLDRDEFNRNMIIKQWEENRD
jgi:acetolactate synthase I/II/III large subunit